MQKVYPAAGTKEVPGWLNLDAAKLEGQILSLPERDQIGLNVAENLIVEFYSR
jgi:small subunit ribosomal protein S4